YMFRLAALNPLMVLGVEPQHSFYYQYLALQKYLNLENVFCLPIKFETLPCMQGYFDTVFCMGILYHRKSPVEMLQAMHKLMRKDGNLIVENLVLESKQGLCLFPESRYAKMRNVFFIPDLKCMESWLARAGFSNIKCVDVSKTTIEEQRQTDWIQTESLIDFFDPEDHNKTIEGYPAPVRAIFTASA
ncbi:MAG: tRNA 5-methoxyuridine(34)/uridine 5-oxyacetic acid(34) synthase CmoB, partial [Desulfobacteraceae bacterium]|nr:tRNA 5-methoxyuridine(34)/uridine 5-oxyacetic acid(34) synthase CmoB [Desulfobacteraceae bacterium]